MDIFLAKAKLSKVMTIKPSQVSDLSPPVCGCQRGTPVSVSLQLLSQGPPRSPTLPSKFFANKLHRGKQGKPKQHLTPVSRKQKHIPQLFMMFNKQEGKAWCLNYRSKFILNSKNSYWQHMEIKSLTSHYRSPNGRCSWRVSSEELIVQSDMDKAGAGEKWEMWRNAHTSVEVPSLCSLTPHQRQGWLQLCPRRKKPA